MARTEIVAPGANPMSWADGKYAALGPAIENSGNIVRNDLSEPRLNTFCLQKRNNRTCGHKQNTGLDVISVLFESPYHDVKQVPSAKNAFNMKTTVLPSRPHKICECFDR